MSYLHQFDYIFAIGVIFAFLDAFNIGANDVANSFSSSVASRSLAYWQAMILAAICEFLGATLVGARVSTTIRKGIVDISAFEGSPAGLMLTMACALVGSSLWLSLATKIGMPVSTTHSIVGGVIGASIASVGAEHVIWGWEGFAQIVASWFIAPVLGGVIAACIFLIIKFSILERKHGLRNVLIFTPLVVFTTFSVLTMLIVWDGSPELKLDDLSEGVTGGAIVGTAGVATLLYLLCVHPVFKRRLMHDDWTIPWYHMPIGFIYYFKSTDNIPPLPEGKTVVPDYYKGKGSQAVKDAQALSSPVVDNEAVESSSNEQKEISEEIELENQVEKRAKEFTVESRGITAENISFTTTHYKGETKIWFQLLKNPIKYPLLIYLIFTRGIRVDVIEAQIHDGSRLSSGVENIHARSKQYDIKVEHVFSLLQAITACTMSFAHGANDISNAAGPLSTIYLVWNSNTTASKADVPIWVLCFTAASLVIGLWTFGYKIMSVLGNKLILQSPSRGFSLELAAAITVVFATRLDIPVSTTQIATGCTVAVGLCNLDLKGINWKLVIWIYAGWLITLPIAGLIAGILCGIIINAPRMGVTYAMS